MGMREDLDRAAKSHHWWPKGVALEMLEKLAHQLREAPDDARLTLRMGMKEEGTLNPWLCVEHPKEQYEGFDDTFLCPPFC